MIPLFVSLLLSVVLFSLVLFIGVLFILGGVLLWIFASTAELRAKAPAILIYGFALLPAPTIIMTLSILTGDPPQ